MNSILFLTVQNTTISGNFVLNYSTMDAFHIFIHPIINYSILQRIMLFWNIAVESCCKKIVYKVLCIFPNTVMTCVCMAMFGDFNKSYDFPTR